LKKEGWAEGEPKPEEADQFETKTAKDKDGNDVKLMKKKEEPVTASVDTSVYESVAQRFRKAYKNI
jgi:hypothetical protein